MAQSCIFFQKEPIVASKNWNPQKTEFFLIFFFWTILLKMHKKKFDSFFFYLAHQAKRKIAPHHPCPGCYPPNKSHKQ